jgi:hypothetical protein
MVLIKLRALKETRSFYNWKLKDKGLTKKQRDSFLLALKNIEGIIREKEKAGEKRKHKRFIAYDHKTVFHNNKSYRGY